MTDAPPSSSDLAPTQRTTLRRKRERGLFDRTTVHAILDAGVVCHVGIVDEGTTYVVPMAYVRIDDALYLHGAVGNRTMRTLASGVEACVTVTLVDGLVLSRSAFHHSVNYRSVMVLGRAARVEDPGEQRRASAALLDHMVAGRSAQARPPTDEELRNTLFVRIPIEEASAKVRTGPPIEEPEDLALSVWGGELPFVTRGGAPLHDGLGVVVPAPASIADYRRPG